MNWKEIWERKGNTESKNLKTLDGFESTNIDPEQVANKIMEALKIRPNDSVLEIGCGAGMLAQYIAPKCKYTGIDFSVSSIKKHKQLLGNKVFVADANKLPFEDNEFDKTFSYSVFHYFPDFTYVGEVMEEIRRVTKGIFLIGDLPMVSHDENHLLFNVKYFEEESIFSIGYYNGDRFNVLIKWKDEYY